VHRHDFRCLVDRARHHGAAGHVRGHRHCVRAGCPLHVAGVYFASLTMTGGASSIANPDRLLNSAAVRRHLDGLAWVLHFVAPCSCCGSHATLCCGYHAALCVAHGSFGVRVSQLFAVSAWRHVSFNGGSSWRSRLPHRRLRCLWAVVRLPGLCAVCLHGSPAR
jgi:hypothetical protein